MEDIIRNSNDPTPSTQGRSEPRLSRRSTYLDLLLIDLSECKKKILKHIDSYILTQENLQIRITSVSSSTLAKLESLANEVDQEISRVNGMIEGRSEDTDSYITKLESGGIGAVLENYDKIISLDLDTDLDEFNKKLHNELLQNSEEYMDLKYDVERLNSLLADSRNNERIFQVQLLNSLENAQKIQEELTSLRNLYNHTVADLKLLKESLEDEVKKLYEGLEEKTKTIVTLSKLKEEQEGEFHHKIQTLQAETTRQLSELHKLINIKREEKIKIHQQFSSLENAHSKLQANYEQLSKLYKDKEKKLQQECQNLKKDNYKLQEQLKQFEKMKEEQGIYIEQIHILQDKLKQLQASYNQLYETKDEKDTILIKESGIPREQRDRIFDDFKRLSRAKEEEEVRFKNQIHTLERKLLETRDQCRQINREKEEAEARIKSEYEELKEEEYKILVSTEQLVRSNYEKTREVIWDNMDIFISMVFISIWLLVSYPCWPLYI
jgi:DNA repair exonuclease SbcCD ATPase subunit